MWWGLAHSQITTSQTKQNKKQLTYRALLPSNDNTDISVTVHDAVGMCAASKFWEKH